MASYLVYIGRFFFCSKQTSKLSQLQIKKFEFIIFLAVSLMNRGKSSNMNESSIRVNNTFR